MKMLFIASSPLQQKADYGPWLGHLLIHLPGFLKPVGLFPIHLQFFHLYSHLLCLPTHHPFTFNPSPPHQSHSSVPPPVPPCRPCISPAPAPHTRRLRGTHPCTSFPIQPQCLHLIRNRQCVPGRGSAVVGTGRGVILSFGVDLAHSIQVHF